MCRSQRNILHQSACRRRPLTGASRPKEPDSPFGGSAVSPAYQGPLPRATGIALPTGCDSIGKSRAGRLARRHASVVLILWKELGIVHEEGAASSHLSLSHHRLPHPAPILKSRYSVNWKGAEYNQVNSVTSSCPASPTPYATSPLSGCHATRLRRPMSATSQYLACASSAPQRSSTSD
jgi:hypothetical protein